MQFKRTKEIKNYLTTLSALLLSGVLLVTCAAPAPPEETSTQPSEEASPTKEEPVVEPTEIPQPTQGPPRETDITIDGDPYDWEGYEVLLTDPQGDHRDGGFDIVVVRAFSNDKFLYLLIETHQPPTDYAQVDLDVSAGSREFLVSFSPQDLSMGFVGESIDGELRAIGNAAGSKSAAGEAVEFKIPLSAFGDASGLRLGVRSMGGACCEPPDWHVIDETNQAMAVQLDETEPIQDLTLPPLNSGQTLMVEQTQVDLGNARCDEPLDIVTNQDRSLAYVICRSVDMLYAIDTATDQVIDTLDLHEEAQHPFGLFPKHITITPDGTQLLIANDVDESITFVDTETFSIITTLHIEGFWIEPAVFPDSKLAYDVGGGVLCVIDLEEHEVLTRAPISIEGGWAPVAITIAPDGTTAYLATAGGAFLQIDTATHQVTRRIDLSRLGWRGDLIITQDGTTAYIAAIEANWIGEIDLVNMELTRRFEVQKPQSLLLNEDESLLYFGTFGSFLEGVEPVGIIDLASGELINQISFITPAPHVAWSPDIEGLAFVGDGSRIYAPGVDSDGVFVIDVEAQNQSAFIPLTEYAIRQPEKLVINSDGSTLYTVNVAPQAPSLSIVDTASGDVDTQFYLQEDDPCFGQATSLDITPDDEAIYVSTDRCLLRFDIEASTFVDVTAIELSGETIRDVAVHPDGSSIYIIDSGGAVSAVDRDSLDVTDSVQAVEQGHNIKISPDGTRVYVTGSRQYAAIDTATNTVITSETIRIGEGEQFTDYPDRQIGIPPGHAFYTIGDFFHMLVYDAATNQLLQEIDLEPWAPGRTLATDAIFSPDGSTGYLALWDLKGVTAFDATTWQVTAQIDTGYNPVFGICPNDFAISPDGGRLYVSAEQSDNIIVIDTETNQVIDTIDLVPEGP